MRKFNPEKELYKIQYENRNKIIFVVMVLLLIISIGSTYALYQIRYNKQIIYTKVAPFYNKDIIVSVKLDNQEKSTNKFPDKEEGYVYSHIECENGNITNDSWNDRDWNLTASIKGPDKCTVFFVKSPFYRESCNAKTMSECLLTNPEEINQLANDDPDNNSRYIGENPNNYIWFNCDDFNAPSEETCERWRIIGAFNNIEKVNEDGESTTEQNLVKIIRTEPIGRLKWDSNNSNNWENASLQQLLNNNYLTPNDTGDWITDNRDAKYKFITNTTREKLIEQVKWNLGGWSTNEITAQQFYEYERENTTYDSQPSTWPGYIGLMYPSDYGFATTGSNDGRDRTTCLNTILFNYGGSTYCHEKDWLYIQSYQWTLTPSSSNSKDVFGMRPIGHVYIDYAAYPCTIRPALYLKSNVKILNGSGSYSSPYTITTD